MRSHDRTNIIKKSGQSNWNAEKIENIGPQVVRDRITIAMNEMIRAADLGAHRSSIASFAAGFVKICRMSIFKKVDGFCVRGS